MAKFFAVTIIVIAIASAIPILRHTWWMPEDISTHGALIDEQMSETMAEAGISFLAAQFILAIFIWQILQPPPGRKDQELSRRRQGFGDCRHSCWWARKFWPLGSSEPRLGPTSISRRPRPTPCRFRCRPDSSRSISAIPAPMESSVRFTRTMINEGNAEFLRPRSRPRSGFQGRHRDRRNGDSGEQGNPSADALRRMLDIPSLCGSCGCSRILFPAWMFRFISPQPRSASTKSSVPSFVAWDTTT